MTTKTKLLLVALGTATATSLLVTACKKNSNCTPPKVTSNSAASQNIQNKNMKHVPEKMLNLTSEQCIALVQKFKSNGKVQNQAGKLIEADSLGLDSATWVLEAAVNYDFDTQYEETYETSFTTLSTTIAINDANLNISSDDLESVYESLSSSISGLVNTTLTVAMIDVEGYIYDPGTGTAIFDLKVQLLNSATPITCHVPSYYISGTPSCILPCANSNYFTNFGCNSSGSPDAISLLNTALNCFAPQFDSNCPHHWYWTSVQYDFPGINTTTFNNPYPNAIFSSGLQTLSYFCPPLCISATQLDNYYYGAIALGNSSQYTPPGFALIFLSYSPQGNLNFNTSNTQACFSWELVMGHGIRNCYAMQPE